MVPDICTRQAARANNSFVDESALLGRGLLRLPDAVDQLDFGLDRGVERDLQELRLQLCAGECVSQSGEELVGAHLSVRSEEDAAEAEAGFHLVDATDHVSADTNCGRWGEDVVYLHACGGSRGDLDLVGSDLLELR